MLYRDLLSPGPAFLGSHIRIPEAGPVGDWVHYHRVDFQIIFCHRGWIRVVYEDQGEPIVMQAGDCVLQPPTIRHRVLQCSAGAEVFEVVAPAGHETHADPDLELPTPDLRPDRRFEGQTFVFSRGGAGIADASGGRVAVALLTGARQVRHDGALGLLVARTDATVGQESLAPGDAVSVPAGRTVLLEGEALWVTVPR
jgi:quercetin dioxygenase-like cupin family protein